MKTAAARLIAVLVIFGLIFSPTGSPVFSQDGPSPIAPRVESLNDPFLAKVHAELREQVASSRPGQKILVLARIKPGTDLNPFFSSRVLIRPFIDPLGLQAAIGSIRATNVIKLAALDGVVFLQKAASILEVPISPDPDVAFKVSRSAIQERLQQAIQIQAAAQAEAEALAAAQALAEAQDGADLTPEETDVASETSEPEAAVEQTPVATEDAATEEPAPAPSETATEAAADPPTAMPTEEAVAPTAVPTETAIDPTAVPSAEPVPPTASPTGEPSPVPTAAPTAEAPSDEIVDEDPVDEDAAGEEQPPAAEAPPPAPDPSGWFDVLEGHHSSTAWSRGFTGDGVKVMVNDSGPDFAHPDLQGTTARISDPSSAYYGWPEQFDSFSMYLSVLDGFFGTSFVADGDADYADTSTLCTTDPCTYQPIGASGSHDYTLTGTSLSGTYHIGSHPDKALQLWWYGERVAVLVVDEGSPGVYDTVYVDLNNNYDFSDDKAARKGDEIAFWDIEPDGYADVSGGMIYFIADGLHTTPACDWLWGFLCPVFGAGDLVAFAINDPTEPAGDHGQLTASNVVGQGVVDHPAVSGAYPTWKPGGVGLVQGAGKDVGLVSNGNAYITPFIEDAFLFAALGYDGVPGTDDDVQIVTNSWGFSSVDNDYWDFTSRQIDLIQRALNPTMSVLFSTGNGAAGYGTVAPPSPPSGIGVGASTQYGSTGTFDSIQDLDQIVFGDVMSWSNRGPSALGGTGVDVVGNGAWGAGALSLNEVGNGLIAWDTWGGTSRSSPVAAANLALIYDAYHSVHGAWPSYTVAKALLKSSATDLNYDPVVQGAGSVNADRGTAVAAGLDGIFVTPDTWRAGSYRGVDYPAFASLLYPGESDSQTFTIHNPSGSSVTLALGDETLLRIGRQEIDFRTMNQTLEEKSFGKPDYLWNLTPEIPPGTDLMEIKVVFPFNQFDPDADNAAESLWRVLVYDWKDRNGDGNLWTDSNGNGVVNASEIDRGEYIRYTYGYNTGTSIQARVQDPLGRSHDGVFLGLRHRAATSAVPRTDLKIQINYYQQMDWDLLSLSGSSLTVPGGGSRTFTAAVTLPAGTPPGFYQGSIRVHDPASGGYPGHTTIVPVTVNVAGGTFAGPDQPNPAGNELEAINFQLGGAEARTPYDNLNLFGYFDWSWRAESGDWRFFFIEEPNQSETQQLYQFQKSILVDLQWSDAGSAQPSDADVLIFGPELDEFSFFEPDYYGPYALGLLGGSPNTNIGRGVWRFDTSTGGPRELVSATWEPGLNLIAVHNVLFSGQDTSEPINGQIGSVTVWPGEINARSRYPAHVYNRHPALFRSSIPLSGLVVEGFGLGKPETASGLPASQDDPNDPSSASFTQVVTIKHGARLEVSTSNSPGNDLDLFLLFDANKDGVFDWDSELIGASTTPTEEEFISVTFPQDGNYLIGVQGWSVPLGSATFDLTINAVQGYNLTARSPHKGPIRAGRSQNFMIYWDTTGLERGEYFGVVLIGPPEAPGAVSLPVTITVR